MNKLELWGGPECTLNRVGESFRDQLKESGHDHRLTDLDLFAELGLSAVRYPVLWESVAPDRPDECHWDWADARLSRLRELGIRPIVGLVHHGSGPRYTNLLADDFAPGLANHARQVAERYPWLSAWTPVNEPLTTARFSGLYGHWYPHAHDEGSFWRALVNQIDGVRLSMREVRRINPEAQLIQTDDLGRTFATSTMRDQAAFDNVRRWMGWDLLCGRVVPGHCLWKRLCEFGLEDRLRAIADAPCPPDIIGVNHYLTSDRFLDHRVRRYADHLRGSNGQANYVDTEAVRVLDPPPPGMAGVLREAWERYGIPLAVTEVHNGCTREEQMRWMVEAWCAAQELRAEGVDLRAVTAWSLLGSFGWDTLLTGQGSYEAGVFDVSSGEPRPTAMVPLLKALARGDEPNPAWAGEGWWRRSIRLHHRPVPRPAPMRDRPPIVGTPTAPLLLMRDEKVDAVAARCDHRNIRFAVVDEAALMELRQISRGAPQPWAVLASRSRSPEMEASCAARGILVADVPDGDMPPDVLLDGLIDQAGPILLPS